MILLGGLLLSFSRGAWTHFAISTAIGIAIVLRSRPTRASARASSCLAFLVRPSWLCCWSRCRPSARSTTCSSSVPRRSSRMTSGPVDGSGSRRSRSASFSITRTAWGRSSSTASMGCSSTTSICRAFWSTAGSAARPIWRWSRSRYCSGSHRSVPTPWQNYLITAYAIFVGEAFEGFIVDTDHWRHFFLILGVIWGLTAASINLRRRQAWAPEVDAAFATVGA